MASSGKTSNYQLNQWTSNDYVRMADFNADNQKIDTALKALDSRAKIIYGTYVGTGGHGSASPKSLDFSATLGEAPKLFYIGGSTYPMLVVRGETAVTLFPMDNNTRVVVNWTNTGLNWYNSYDDSYQFNVSGHTYYYIAIA